MEFINITRIALAVGVMTFSFTTFADETTLACPTVDLVTQVWADVNNAIPDDRSYIVTSEPVINFAQRLWSVRTVVPARSQEDAIKLAQITVKETKALITPTAIKIFNQYGCEYFSARAFVYALTDAS